MKRFITLATVLLVCLASVQLAQAEDQSNKKKKKKAQTDGILGPGTRNAIQRYQINHGLAVTAAIDEQTLYTLGLT